MSAVRELAARVLGFVARRGRSRDLDDELRFHLQMMEEELRRQGMDSDSARREARLRVGGAAQIAESYRDQQAHWLPIRRALRVDPAAALRHD